MSQELQAKFIEIYGHAAEVAASAPGRVNIIGEHVDYNDGWVLPFAIDYRTNVLLRRREDQQILITSNQRPGQTLNYDAAKLAPKQEWGDYVAGVMMALDVNAGFEVLVDGNVPAGAGLSSSAALECAVAIGLNALLHLGYTGKELALAAQKAENVFVGMPCGIMDQAVSVLAEADHALLLDCRTMETTQIPLEISHAGLQWLVIDTQAHHALVDGGYAARRATCEEVAAILGVAALRDATMSQLDAIKPMLEVTQYNRARHAITEMTRVHETVKALQAGDYEAVGKLLTATHMSLRDDYTVSCPELDVAVDAANAAGALGARMVGGGFGGSALALVQSSNLAAVRSAVSDAFAAAGFKPPRFFAALPAAGAHATLL